MPASSEVPTSYTSRWKANTPRAAIHPISPSSTSSHSAVSKYNASCNACRKARVKCSGGKPCRKCAASANPESCIYSVSQRRGRRKANDGPYQEPAAEASLPLQGDPLDIAAFDSTLLQGWPGPHEDPWPEPPLPWPSGAGRTPLFGEAHAIGDLGSLPETLPLGGTTTPASSHPNREGEKCPDACFALVHTDGNKLISTLNERGAVGLDKCMAVLDSASSHASKYLACSLCDTGCTRLMTLALTHQRQLNLLCDIAANPSLYLSDGTRASLGAYKSLSRETDVAVKRAMLLGVVRAARRPVEGIKERVGGFAEKVETGAMEIAEAGRLNLKWLLGITGNLTRRLDTVKVVLEREDWGASAEG